MKTVSRNISIIGILKSLAGFLMLLNSTTGFSGHFPYPSCTLGVFKSHSYDSGHYISSIGKDAK